MLIPNITWGRTAGEPGERLRCLKPNTPIDSLVKTLQEGMFVSAHIQLCEALSNDLWLCYL